MIGRLIFRLFGLEEKPGYENVKKLSSIKPLKPPESPDLLKHAEYLVEKHMVDGMSVFTEDGALVFSTYNEDDAEHEFAIFSYINEEFEDVPYAFFKRGDWILFYRRRGRVYIVHAPSYLSLAELSALARDVERVLFGVGF